MESILFWVFSIAAIGGALGMVGTLRNTVYSALWLVVSMLALACLFIMLNAQFVGLIQVMVYAGAIVVLFLFVVMLLNLTGGVMGAEEQPLLKFVGVALAVAVSLQLGSILLRIELPWPEVSPEYGTTAEIGRALYTDYLLPFEVAGVLLLAAIVAALAMAKRERG